MDKEKIETIKWKLTELAAAEPDFIDSNDYEILGEDGQGRDGYCTVQINNVADETMELINHLQLELGLMSISRDGLQDRLAACEKALEERDAK